MILKEGRKDELFRAAESLIMEQGLEKIRIKDIIERAHISKAGFYLYYNSKEELFQDLCDCLSAKVIKNIQDNPPAEGKQANALDLIKNIWLIFRKSLLSGAGTDIIAIFRMRKYLTPQLSFARYNTTAGEKTPIYAVYKMLASLFDQGIREGVFLPLAGSDNLAQLIISLFSHLVEDMADFPATGPGEATSPGNFLGRLDTLFTIFLRGIMRNNTPAPRNSTPAPHNSAVDNGDGKGPAEAKLQWFKKNLPLLEDFADADTTARVFEGINKQELGRALQHLISALFG